MDISNIEHASITDDNRAALSTHMEKFDSFESAALDGMALKKMTGSPFKMPESMDNLPDDASRLDFSSKANRLLGRDFAADVAGLSGLDLKLNSTSDAMDETMANTFKQFVIDEKISNSDAQKIIGFHNKAMGTSREAVAVATKAAQDTADAKFIVDKKACNDALVAHADFAGQENLDKQNILLHRALKDNAGISAEEADGVAMFLSEGEGATNPVLRRLLLKAYAPMAASSETDGGDGKPVGNKPAMSEGEKKKDDELKKVLKWK